MTLKTDRKRSADLPRRTEKDSPSVRDEKCFFHVRLRSGKRESKLS